MTADRPLTVAKTRVDEIIDADHRLTHLVYAYLACSTVWLVFGTLVGEYLGLKFAWPDLGVAPWLSFGRLRPVHTNVVFWGWTSLSMIALALWVVPRTSQKALHSLRLGWVSLGLINVAVLAGVIQLLLGVSNGAGEFREFVWPVMGIFAAGLVLLAYNLYRTIADRGTEEIYISNWYTLAAFLMTILLVTTAYVPWYQHGLGAYSAGTGTTTSRIHVPSSLFPMRKAATIRMCFDVSPGADWGLVALEGVGRDPAGIPGRSGHKVRGRPTTVRPDPCVEFGAGPGTAGRDPTRPWGPSAQDPLPTTAFGLAIPQGSPR